MAEKKTKDDLAKFSFEQAIKELTGIVSQIEQGQIPLQDSLQQYEKGMALIKHCRGILQKAEKRIEKISEQEQKAPESTDDQ
ncbi:MAG: exodeoxyribonuclease VII small subunit [Planctomycetota bacterium]|jgi:exodeoxyribonuclease VII small subunit